jgi:hypothetical protein
MVKRLIFIAAFLMTLLIYSCSRKTHPAKTSSETVKKNTDSTSATKTIKRKPRAVLPKVIVVNDSAAHKSIDGRLYYDVMGHRYWRNNKDGKYYLFDKSMYNNPDFKKQ